MSVLEKKLDFKRKTQEALLRPQTNLLTHLLLMNVRSTRPFFGGGTKPPALRRFRFKWRFMFFCYVVQLRLPISIKYKYPFTYINEYSATFDS